MSKLNFSSLKKTAQEVANNPNVEAFIQEADNPIIHKEVEDEGNSASLKQSSKKSQKTVHPFKKSSKPPKILTVEGYLPERDKTCSPQQGIYLKKELFDWIEQNTIGVPGGKQIVINCLIAYGICSVIEEYQKNGCINYDFAEQWSYIKDFIEASDQEVA